MKTDANMNASVMSALIKPTSHAKTDGKARGDAVFGGESGCIEPETSSMNGDEAAKAGKAFADTLKEKISPNADGSENKQEQNSDETPDTAINLPVIGVVCEQQISNPVILEVTSQAVGQISAEPNQQTSPTQTPAVSTISAVTTPTIANPVISPVNAEKEPVLPVIGENTAEVAEALGVVVPVVSSEINTQAQQPIVQPPAFDEVLASVEVAKQAENIVLPPSTELAAAPKTPIILQDLAAPAPADTETAVEVTKSVNPLMGNVLDSAVEQPAQSGPKLTSPVPTAYTQENLAGSQEAIVSKAKSQTSDAVAITEPIAESDIDIDTVILPQEQLAGKNIKSQSTSQPSLNADSNFGSEVSAQAIANNPQQTTGKDFSVASTTEVPSEIHDKNFGSTVREQVRNFIQSSYQPGNQQISFRLNPANLGSVAVNFQENADGIAGTLQVNNPQTKDEIQRAIPEMIRNLSDAGIQIKKLEVVLTNQQSYNNAKDQSFNPGQDSNPSQQNSPESGQTNGGTNQNQWKTNITNSNKFDQQQGYHTDKSINMLA